MLEPLKGVRVRFRTEAFFLSNFVQVDKCFRRWEGTCNTASCYYSNAKVLNKKYYPTRSTWVKPL